MAVNFKLRPRTHRDIHLNTEAEAGAQLGDEKKPKAVSTLRRMRREGRGPRYVRIGNKVFYTDQALADYVAALEQEPGTKR